MKRVKHPVHPSWIEDYEKWKKCKTDIERLEFAFSYMTHPRVWEDLRRKVKNNKRNVK